MTRINKALSNHGLPAAGLVLAGLLLLPAASFGWADLPLLEDRDQFVGYERDGFPFPDDGSSAGHSPAEAVTAPAKESAGFNLLPYQRFWFLSQEYCNRLDFIKANRPTGPPRDSVPK